MNKPLPFEDFNRELDRAARGDAPARDDLTPEDQSALQLAQRLAITDLSGSSLIQQSLRRRLAERAIRHPIRDGSLRRFFWLRNGRTLAGAGVVVLLTFIWIFRFLSPQNVSATPAYLPMAASRDLSVKPAASLTVAIAHSPNLIPQPVPTPMAINVPVAQSSSLLVGTPARTNIPLGSQFPIVTTIVSK